MLNFSFAYDLPFGNGRKWLNQGGVVNRLVGGWQVSSILQLQSGPPIQFTSGYCNVPSAFACRLLSGNTAGSQSVSDEQE